MHMIVRGTCLEVGIWKNKNDKKLNKNKLERKYNFPKLFYNIGIEKVACVKMCTERFCEHFETFGEFLLSSINI